MLIPSTKVVFEGLSREYYGRMKDLAVSGFSGCVRLAFEDFEGVVFYAGGRPVTALQECGSWMALGEELVAPLENKADVTDGSMAIYEIAPEMLDFFAGRKIVSTVESELVPPLGPQALLNNLLRDRSVCIFRAKGPAWIGYAFLAAGRILNAAYASDRERLEGDRATAALRQASGHIAAAIYFLEGGVPYVEVTPSVEMPSTAAPPVEVMRPPEPGTAPVEKVVAGPAPAPEAAAAGLPEARLTVVTAKDKDVPLRHPSKLVTLEALEDRSVAWVDETVLAKLGLKEAGIAGLALPGGRTEQVILLKMELLSGQGKLVILPRKLRRRLAVAPGAVVALHPGSALVPVR